MIPLLNSKHPIRVGINTRLSDPGFIIHSIDPGAEFYITIYGSIAQSESENISANVRWGKAQSAREGKVPFNYKRSIGYTSTPRRVLRPVRGDFSFFNFEKPPSGN